MYVPSEKTRLLGHKITIKVKFLFRQKSDFVHRFELVSNKENGCVTW